MRRFVIVGAFAGIGYFAFRTGVPKLHERMMAKCHAMFEQMTGHAGGEAGGPCQGAAQSPCAGTPPTEGARDVA